MTTGLTAAIFFQELGCRLKNVNDIDSWRCFAIKLQLNADVHRPSSSNTMPYQVHRWVQLQLTTHHQYMTDITVVLGNREQNIHTYIHPFNGPLSGTTRVSRYQKQEGHLACK